MNTMTATADRNTSGVASALMSNAPVQTGVGVSAITLVAQVFAREEVQSVVPLPAIAVALLTALLLALHNVHFVQRASTGESLILVPLSAIILFAMSLGANNLVGSQTDGEQDLNQVDRQLLEIQSAKDQLEAALATPKVEEPKPVQPQFRSPGGSPASALAATQIRPQPDVSRLNQQQLERLRLQEQQLLERRARLLEKKKSLWKTW
jgi:hypothetical protein